MAHLYEHRAKIEAVVRRNDCNAALDTLCTNVGATPSKHMEDAAFDIAISARRRRTIQV